MRYDHLDGPTEIPRRCACDRAPALPGADACGACLVVVALEADDPQEAAAVAAEAGLSTRTLLRITRDVAEARLRHDRAAELERVRRATRAA